MNISIDGGFLRPFGNEMLKSTQERMERQKQTESQVAFFEEQKNNLKNMLCESPEDIMRKLDMLHSYEDQIAAVKAAYNNEQIYHIMDEAREMGEKIAEAVENSKPKTPEERKENLVEEATGVEEQDGVLSEIMDELEEVLEVAEELEAEKEILSGEDGEKLSDEGTEIVGTKAAGTENAFLQGEIIPGEEKNHIYRPFDTKI